MAFEIGIFVIAICMTRFISYSEFTKIYDYFITCLLSGYGINSVVHVLKNKKIKQIRKQPKKEEFIVPKKIIPLLKVFPNYRK